MDRFYHGLETSLLALGLVLGFAALSASVILPRPMVAEPLAVTLPTISVGPEEPTP